LHRVQFRDLKIERHPTTSMVIIFLQDHLLLHPLLSIAQVDSARADIHYFLVLKAMKTRKIITVNLVTVTTETTMAMKVAATRR
jgi:hypothetical protein